MIEEILIFSFCVFGVMSILCCIPVGIGWGREWWQVGISFGGFILFGILIGLFIEPPQTPYISPTDQAYNEGFQEGLNNCLKDEPGEAR